MRLLGSPSTGHGMIVDTVRDILVVIVGILAALWLEAWWQGLADRETEQDILATTDRIIDLIDAAVSSGAD